MVGRERGATVGIKESAGRNLERVWIQIQTVTLEKYRMTFLDRLLSIGLGRLLPHLQPPYFRKAECIERALPSTKPCFQDNLGIVCV